MIAGIQYGLYLGLYSSRVKAHIFKPVIRKSAEWFHARNGRNLIENHTNFLENVQVQHFGHDLQQTLSKLWNVWHPTYICDNAGLILVHVFHNYGVDLASITTFKVMSLMSLCN